MCFGKPDDVLWASTSLPRCARPAEHLAEAAFSLACLPYEAFYSLGAILRTVWRMLITHRRLLEWNTAADSKRNSRTGLAGSYLTMWIAPVIAAAAAICLVLVQAGRACRCLADTGALVCLTGYRLVDQPAARPPGSAAVGRTDRLSPESFPKNLGVLRDICRPGR